MFSPQLLATKLGQSTSSLFLSKSDDVLAEQLWFDPDGLAGLIEWVDEIMAPDSTFFTVVRVSCWQLLLALTNAFTGPLVLPTCLKWCGWASYSCEHCLHCP